jgi:hypothetical protein
MRAGESKSTDSPFAINARSEKSAKFNLFQINSFALVQNELAQLGLFASYIEFWSK